MTLNADDGNGGNGNAMFLWTIGAPPAACTDPTACNPVASIPAQWECDIPGCTDSDWTGTVINWPSWSAYEANGRSDSNSRTVYSPEGDTLYPYMGPWADGCRVTGIAGTVEIIEWQRGADVWRQTTLGPGETHTIALLPPEDNAVIEGLDITTGFTVLIENCTPQNIGGSNSAPTVDSPGDQNNQEGETVTLPITANDDDGDTLTFSASGLPANLGIDPSSGQIAGTLAPGSAGVYNVTVTVDDGNDGVDSAAFTWTVSPSTDPLVDWGDLPEGIGFSYFTTNANNGPRHNLSASGPLLGSQVDPEIDGSQTANALGDDNSDADDEDGVTFSLVNEEIEVVVANVSVGQTALLGAWFDWNNDGDFGDDNEFQSFTVNPGSNTLPVVVDPGYYELRSVRSFPYLLQRFRSGRQLGCR